MMTKYLLGNMLRLSWICLVLQESLLSSDQVPTSANIATITMGEHGQQQVFVITDPAQLEALQVS